MADEVAHDGGEQRAGDCLIGDAVEEAEGMAEWVDAELAWREPGEANRQVEVSVRDAGDGRFVPGGRVLATLLDPSGNAVGTHEQPLLRHPMISHDGRNGTDPTDSRSLRCARVEPPTFKRHDEVNGRRFWEPVDVAFGKVKVKRGRGSGRPAPGRRRGPPPASWPTREDRSVPSHHRHDRRVP